MYFRRRGSLVAAKACALFVALGAWVLCPSARRAEAAELAATATFRTSIEPLLESYCYSCHAYGEKNGGVAFDGFKSSAELVGNHQLWWRVLKNVRAGIMPPEGEDRPSPEEKRAIEEWIKYQAFGIDADDPDPGRQSLISILSRLVQSVPP